MQEKKCLVVFMETFMQDLHFILSSCKAINMYCFLNEAINSDESFIVEKTVLASRTKTSIKFMSLEIIQQIL